MSYILEDVTPRVHSSDTPDSIVIQLAMQANALSEVVVKTTMVDRYNAYLCLTNALPEVKSAKKAFDVMKKNSATGIFGSIVSPFHARNQAFFVCSIVMNRMRIVVSHA